MNNLLQQLKDAGAFASDELHTAEIELPGGTATVYVKELTDAAVRGFFTAAGGYDRAYIIAAAIVDENGKPLMKPEQAKTLKPSFATNLEKAVLKFNGAGTAAKEEAEESGK